MEITELLDVQTARSWRRWLSRNFLKKKEVWLLYHKKSSGNKRISYNDAVNQALCYGWIDSIVKNINEHSFAQRFTPRRSSSILSQLNRERIRKLIRTGEMTSHGLKAVAHTFDAKRDNPSEFKYPKEILYEIKKNRLAWKHFRELPEHYKRVRIQYIEDYRKVDKEIFRKRLNHFIDMTSKNKRFGFVRN